MPNTAKGYPYPNPSDPVASGSADIKALAEMVDKQFGRLIDRTALVTRTTPASIGGAAGQLTWQNEIHDPSGLYPYGGGIIVPYPGIYVVTASIFFSGGGGTGFGRAWIQRLTDTSVFIEDVAGDRCDTINGMISISGIVTTSAGNYFRVMGEASATGAGQNWTGRFGIHPLTPSAA